MEQDAQPARETASAWRHEDAETGQPGTIDWRRLDLAKHGSPEHGSPEHGSLWIHPSLVSLVGPVDPALSATAKALARAAREVRWDESGWSATVAVGVAGSALQSAIDAPPADLDVGLHLLLRANGKRVRRVRTLGSGLAATMRACFAALAAEGAVLGRAETTDDSRTRLAWTSDQLTEAQVPGSRLEREWHSALEQSHSTNALFLPSATDLPCPVDLELHHSVFFDDGRYRLESGAFATATGRAVFERTSLHAYGSLTTARRRTSGPDAATPAEILSEFARVAAEHRAAERWLKVARLELASLAYRGEQQALESLMRRPRFAAALELASLATRLATLAQHPRREESLPGWARAVQARLDARGSRHGFDRRRDSAWRGALADLADGETSDATLRAFVEPALARANPSIERSLRRP